MQRRSLTLLQMRLSVHDVGIGARRGAVKWPLEAGEADRQPGQRYIGIRPGIPQPHCRLAQVGSHLGQQLGPLKIERLTQLKLQCSVWRRIGYESEPESRSRVVD